MSTNKDFECHITIAIDSPFSIGYPAAVQAEVEGILWSFSCIDGDPQLGKKKHCYATKYFEDQETAIGSTLLAAEYLESRGLHIVRSKVEKIVFDSRR